MKIVLFSALPTDGSAPDWVQLVPAGTINTKDGRGPYYLRDADAVITASMSSGPIAIDENHAIDHAMKTGIASPARGWVVEMQSRADGIWGRVEWNASGVQLMTERAYRGISPALGVDPKTNVVVRIHRASLTNTPNLTDLATLHTEEPTMDITKLRKALDLPDTADEEAILARVAADATAISTHAAQLGKIAKAAGVAESTNADGLVTVLSTQKRAVSETQGLAQTVVQLQTQLTTLQAEQSRGKAEAFVDAQIAAGKPITPLRAHYITRHMADPTSVETELNALVSLHSAGLTPQQIISLQSDTADTDGMAELNSTDREVCEKMGLDPKAMAAQKKASKERMAGAPGAMRQINTGTK